MTYLETKDLKSKKLEQGQEVTINVPYVYEVGQEGPITGDLLNTIEDMEREVRAELEVSDPNLLNLEVEKGAEENSKTFNLLELASELADIKLRETFSGTIDVEIDEEIRYTEEAQDYFNELYDEYYEFLINI